MTTSSEAPGSNVATCGPAFARCRQQARAALIPYVTAGYPSADTTGEVLAMLAETGADVIELGVPFSDPLADGPIIQRASQQAIRSGTTLESSLRDLAAFRREHTVPVVIFSYLNPVLHYGIETFLADAVQAGAGGVLLTDLPAGADARLEDRIDASGLDRIRLVAPTTGPERLRVIADNARGFLYYISRTGVTGAPTERGGALGKEVAAVRRISPVPVAVGFGVDSAARAHQVARAADGVVVGSALVERLGAGGTEAAAGLMRDLRNAMHVEAHAA
ncbi:tryptophan synthase subunit alpha [soil metagenome]